MEKKSEFQVGIDFGTCNIKVARWNNKKARPVRMKLDSDQDDSDYKIPNAIAYLETKSGEVEKIVGKTAIESLDSDNTVENIKYYLQQREWSKFIPSLRKKVDSNDVLKDIFDYLKKTIQEKNAGKDIDSVAITTPVCFSEIQKNRIVQAAKEIGFPIKTVISEPVAALFSVLDELEENKENIVMVLDFGGATLDLSLFSVKQNTEKRDISLLASSGMLYGGIDINNDISEKIFFEKYEELANYFDRNDVSEGVRRDFMHTVEKMKRSVSKKDIVEYKWRPEAFSIELALENPEFISMLKETGKNNVIKQEIDSLLAQSEKSRASVTHLAIIGGSAKVSFFRDFVLSYLADAKMIDFDEDDMYGVVSEGAVKYLHMLGESTFSFTNKIPYAIGVENERGEFVRMISKGARFGHRGRKVKVNSVNGKINVYQTFGESNRTYINEDETIIYMGFFDVEKVLANIKNCKAEFRINHSGDLQLDIYDGTEKVDTMDLKMR